MKQTVYSHKRLCAGRNTDSTLDMTLSKRFPGQRAPGQSAKALSQGEDCRHHPPSHHIGLVRLLRSACLGKEPPLPPAPAIGYGHQALSPHHSVAHHKKNLSHGHSPHPLSRLSRVTTTCSHSYLTSPALQPHPLYECRNYPPSTTIHPSAINKSPFSSTDPPTNQYIHPSIMPPLFCLMPTCLSVFSYPVFHTLCTYTSFSAGVPASSSSLFSISVMLIRIVLWPVAYLPLCTICSALNSSFSSVQFHLSPMNLLT